MMDDDDRNLAVPKRAVTVELALAGRTPLQAQIFVAAHDAHAYRPELVIDLLEHESAFLPARVAGEKAPSLFNKDTVVWAALDDARDDARDEGADDGADGDAPLYDSRREVRVELTRGEPLSGELLYSLPSDRARVADYLNLPGRFFRLWRGGRVVLVNKAYVERVVETPLDLTAPAQEE